MILSTKWALVYFMLDWSYTLTPSNVLGVRHFETEKECAKVLDMEVDAMTNQKTGTYEETRTAARNVRIKCMKVDVPDKL